MATKAEKGRARGKKGVSSVYLIADSRERNVHSFLDAEFQEYAYLIKQVTTADYLICRAPPRGSAGEPAVLAAIERKTLTDFAASFTDGRHENVKKLRALREQTGCQLYYFVEGPAFPSPSRRFARIPYANIQAAITKLMMRDGVFVVQTENESHTAKRLADFVRAFDAERPYAAPRPVAAEGGPPPAEGGDAALGCDDGRGEPLELVVPDVLTARIEQTDDDAAVAMWARLRGISVVLGKILTREFSVAELVAQAVPPGRLQGLKTATGRGINKDALASLTSVRAGSEEHAAKLLSGLRNVTPAVAKLILDETGGLRRLCEMPTVFVAAIALPQKGRTVKLGKVRAERIRRVLHYKEGAAPPAEPEGHSLAGDPSDGPLGGPIDGLLDGDGGLDDSAEDLFDGQSDDQLGGLLDALLDEQLGTDPICGADEPGPALADGDLESMLEAAGWAV